ncbi:MAG: oligosaccharide flippase family protein [Pseudomonadota bacterium]
MSPAFSKRLTGSLLVNAAGAAAVFASQVVVAKYAGITAYGEFAFVFAITQILVVVGKLGYDSATQKLIPEYITRGEHDRASGLIKGSFLAVVGASVIGGAALATWGLLVAEDSLSATVYSAALLIPVLALIKWLKGVLLGFQQTVRAQVFDPLLLFLGWTLAVAIDSYAGSEVSAPRIMATLLTVAAVVLAVNMIVARNAQPPSVRRAAPRYDYRHWFNTALPMLLAYGLVVLMTYTDTLLIGILLGTDEAGVYMISARIASVISMPMAFVGAALAPAVSELIARRNMELLQSRITETARLGLLLAAPLIVVVFAGCHLILEVIGDGYTIGATATRILVVAQFVNVVAGPVGLVLMMSGQHRQVGTVLAATVAGNFLLNLILIPRFGIAGAATATGLAIVGRNLALRMKLSSSHNLEASALRRS